MTLLDIYILHKNYILPIYLKFVESYTTIKTAYYRGGGGGKKIMCYFDVTNVERYMQVQLYMRKSKLSLTFTGSTVVAPPQLL